MDDLHEEALLIKVKIGQGSLTASSKTLTREAAEKHNADPKSFRSVVYKIEGEAREGITQAISKATLAIQRNTLPWTDTGYRLVPMGRYEALMGELNEAETAFNNGVEEMLGRYEELKADYERRTSDISLEVEFPSRQKIREGFYLRVVEMPLANPNDVRLRLMSAEDIARLRERVSTAMNARLIEAQYEIIDKLIEMVERVVRQTDDPKGKIYDTLIGNIAEAANRLPALNLTNDPEINRLIARTNELSSVDPEDIRTDPKVRAATCKLARGILADLTSARGE